MHYSHHLTTLAQVKSWLRVTSTTDDAELLRLIGAISGYVQTVINRQILVATRTSVFSGRNNSLIVMDDYPVVSVSSVTVDGVAIPAASSAVASGYLWDDNGVYLRGYLFTKGVRNVSITYNAGFQLAEAATVPAATPYTVTTARHWLADVSVAYSTGVALTKVSGTPALGQYAVAEGVYTFAAADTGASVVITYSYVPLELEQAVIELIGMRYREKDRIGHVSKTIGQETVTFNVKDMPESVRTILNEYKKVMS